ncbi:MAG: YcaQ family DNA glycosylase [Chloroflexia bacterium]|nr:YcaQ family DNA glycosylase [Chloroflexia bacterium]
MAPTADRSPDLKLSRTEARRFMLAHQRLWPPRQLQGQEGVLSLIGHLGCIQYDPINVVGRNPDLVLQSRVADYRPPLLDEMRYQERILLDGWDKMASIHLATDWPYFARQRARMIEQHGREDNPAWEVAPRVLQAMHERGPLSSIDLKYEQKVDWFWAPTRLARAALETLYAMGHLGIHHRIGTRRVFDLIERLLPAELLQAPDPNETLEDYQRWHVLRRLGSLGLAYPRRDAHWYGIIGVKTRELEVVLAQLIEREQVLAVEVEGLSDRTLFIRQTDLPTLEAVRGGTPPRRQAALIAPLDNLIWDRQLAEWIFEFNYRWEVYTPVAKRQYGYYVLPVLYGDHFVARCEPVLDKKSRHLILQSWWWEDGVRPDGEMLEALGGCLCSFGRYLAAEQVQFGPQATAQFDDLPHVC